jgi:ribosomal protein S27AE
MDNQFCPECNGTMVEGTVIDYRHATVAPEEWIEGQPQVSWTGKVKNEERYQVIAYRCSRCGFLKMYARQPATSRGNVYGS